MTTIPPGALDVVRPAPSEFTRDQIELIKKTVAIGANDDELRLFIHDCQRRGIHPLDRLLHFTKRGGKYTPITSIDFMRSRAAETGEYAGNDDAAFKYADPDAGHPTEATVAVWRIIQGQRCAFTATARWSEYYPGDQLGFMWKKMPHVLLSKCAEALALRKGFPQEVSGLYAAEEMDQAKDVETRIRPPTNAQIEAERATIAADAPADEETKALVVSLVVGANADAKAVLKSYGLLTVGDIERRLTKHTAELFLEAARQGA